MEIHVNKKTLSIPSDFTVGMLLTHINSSRSVAIFVNGKQLLMAEYDHFQLNQNDHIKIIKPLGGG